jgi:hypothetical protein
MFDRCRTSQFLGTALGRDPVIVQIYIAKVEFEKGQYLFYISYRLLETPEILLALVYHDTERMLKHKERLIFPTFKIGFVQKSP